ncbi:hypothetical protein V9T40_005106 [Parthenolecanium corni]|uniref:Ribosomal protein eL8/eL30/eS12/Gadd45 domain-containing protein n=1 Tax=Parthenolecanium corni TaxID=536013 RepID=A0AAN9TD93_9HEMI
MDSILSYSENDFPSLGSSAKGKSRKRNKFTSSVVSQNVDENKLIDQPHQKSSHKKIIEISSCVEKNQHEENDQKLNKSRKPRPTSSVNIEDYLLNREKSCPKVRVRVTKHFKEPSLGGNPLDTDCPLRRKGFMNVPKKPKCLTKIKTVVLEDRKEKNKIKNYSAQISVEKNNVFSKSEVPEEYLWKSVVYGKVNDLKNVMNFGKNSICNETDGTSDGQENDEIPDVKPTASFFEDEEYSYRISLPELLKHSEIPPHKILIHHHNFKSYCDNCITEELNRSSSALISQIVRYQCNKYQINPTKAVANKKYVVGFKQVTKYVKMNKIKLFIIVPDMEDSLSNTVEELKSLANAYCIPYFFALSRRKLGFLTYKKVGVCCFGILNYSGAEMKFKKTLEIMTKTKKYYEEKCLKAKSFYESQFTKTSESDQSTGEVFDKMIQKFNDNFSFSEETEKKIIVDAL